jgi:uncharacterized integral membrane protein
MIGRGGILGALALLVLSTVFAARNGASTVTVDIGFATLERVPLPVVVFGAVLLGMLVMLAAGVHSDLNVRSILKARLTDEGRREREWSDRNQQDLFTAQDEGVSTASVASKTALAPPESLDGQENLVGQESMAGQENMAGQESLADQESMTAPKEVLAASAEVLADPDEVVAASDEVIAAPEGNLAPSEDSSRPEE